MPAALIFENGNPVAGEFQVNVLGGPDENALTADTLDEAVELGRYMAKMLAPGMTTAAVPGKQYRRPRRMTPKAQRRRMIRQHNRRMRARAWHKGDGGKKDN
jgi:hypothetical protein